MPLYDKEQHAPTDLDAEDLEAWEHDELFHCVCGCKERYTLESDGSYQGSTPDWLAEGHEYEEEDYDPVKEHGTYWAQGGSVVG